MRYIVWVLRIIVFVIVLLFALKNTNPVTVNFYGNGMITDVPLIVVLAITFFFGAIFAFLLAIPTRLARRREMRKLKKEVTELQQSNEHKDVIIEQHKSTVYVAPVESTNTAIVKS